MNPLVSFLIPNRNGARFIKECLDSIAAQTFVDWEAIVVDDGSTDASVSLICSFRDSRIRLIRNTEQRGLPQTLNIGLAECWGDYIARLDSDDISLPERLETQVRYMESNPSVAVVGSARIVMGQNRIYNPAVDIEDGSIRIFFENFLAHPTVMMRKAFLAENKLVYDEGFLYAQDYDFWLRIALVGSLASVPEPLVLYRTHEGQTSQKKLVEQIRFAQKARKRAFLLAGFNLNERDLQILESFSSFLVPRIAAEQREVFRLKEHLMEENRRLKFREEQRWIFWVTKAAEGIVYER